MSDPTRFSHNSYLRPTQTEAPPRRVVVTGMGVVSCLGHEHDEFYNNLLAGKSGISYIEVRQAI